MLRPPTGNRLRTLPLSWSLLPQSFYSVKPWLRAGSEFLFMGASVAVVAYAIGGLVLWVGQRYLAHYLMHGTRSL